jgi:hypothetical protein
MESRKWTLTRMINWMSKSTSLIQKGRHNKEANLFWNPISAHQFQKETPKEATFLSYPNTFNTNKFKKKIQSNSHLIKLFQCNKLLSKKTIQWIDDLSSLTPYPSIILPPHLIFISSFWILYFSFSISIPFFFIHLSNSDSPFYYLSKLLKLLVALTIVLWAIMDRNNI